LPSIGSPIVEDPAEPQRRRPHLACGIGDDGATAAPDALEARERHHHGIVAGEADDFGGDETIAAGVDHDARADRHRVNRTCDLDHQAAHADHAAIDIDAVDIADLLGQRLHCESLKFPRFAGLPLTSCLPASLIITSLSLMTESARPSERRSSRESRLGPSLNVDLERERVQKTGSVQYLRAIRQKLHG
jgi:hypothetical protein